MKSAATEATLWESGCQADVVRNQFIAPSVTRLLEKCKPATILDVGTGTGYLPRIIDRALSYRPQWTLIDVNLSRLGLARQLMGSEMHAVTVAANILEYQCAAPFGAVLATFTILEIVEADRFIEQLPMLVDREGIFVVCTPDAWPDVLVHSKKDPMVLSKFLAGQAALPKIDKFTGSSYPFQAIRTERIISKVLSSGFELFQLDESEGNHRAYILAFRRRASTQ